MRRVALVTGASSGLGRAIARRLSVNFDIAAVSRSHQDESETSPVSNCRTSWHRGDLRDADNIPNLVNGVMDTHGRIDILVNCAGVSGGGRTTQQSDALWQEMMVVNLLGPMRLTRDCLRLSGMQERKWGRIINIASTGGKQGVLWGAAYSASKHGLVGFTKSLALELASAGITVNAVCPGFVETPMAEQVRARYAAIWEVSSEEAKKRIIQRIPLGRYVAPEEVADLVAFLTTPSADAIVGQALNICGGLGTY